MPPLVVDETVPILTLIVHMKGGKEKIVSTVIFFMQIYPSKQQYQTSNKKTPPNTCKVVLRKIIGNVGLFNI